MSGCCEEAIAAMKERPNDTDQLIVRVTLDGAPFHVYYRSREWIHNPRIGFIPPYVGPPEHAPQGFYEPWTYDVDEEVISCVD